MWCFHVWFISATVSKPANQVKVILHNKNIGNEGYSTKNEKIKITEGTTEASVKMQLFETNMRLQEAFRHESKFFAVIVFE